MASSSSASRKKLAALPNHALTLCLSRLGAAVRTAIACTIVGVATVYFPPSVRQQIKYPASSYVFTILIVSDATLGDTLRRIILIAYTTALSLLSTMLTSYLARPLGISALTASAAAAINAFVVVMLGGTDLVAKRISLAQIVLIYIAAFDFEQAHVLRPVLHPVPVLATTVVAVAAAVLALLVPFPRLACREVIN